MKGILFFPASYLDCSSHISSLHLIRAHLKCEVSSSYFRRFDLLHKAYGVSVWLFSIQCRQDGFLCFRFIKLLTNKCLLCQELAYSQAGCYNKNLWWAGGRSGWWSGNLSTHTGWKTYFKTHPAPSERNMVVTGSVCVVMAMCQA